MFLLTLLISFGTLQAQNLCSSFSTEPVARTFGPGVTFLSSLHPNGATFSNEKIVVNGTLKVDRNVFFDNCRIVCGSNAQIVLETGSFLLGGNTTFYSCSGDLWKGVLAKTGTLLWLDASRMEDALTAVTLDDGSAAAFNQTVFNRNHIGIRNGDGLSAFSTINIFGFSGVTFDGTSSLNNLPANEAPYPAYTGKAYAGIMLKNVVGSLNATSTSTFRNMHFGAIFNNSDVKVSNCDFSNFVAFPLGQGLDRVGILSDQGRLDVTKCSFSQAAHGIFATGSEMDIQYNSFSLNVAHASSGVTSKSNINTDFITISDNIVAITGVANPVKPGITGIYAQRNSRSGTQVSFDISNNQISMEGPSFTPYSRFAQRGIYVDGTNPSLDIANIFTNIITATAQNDFRQNGIEIFAGAADNFRVMNANNITYTQNTLAYNSTLRWGISMLYGTGIGHQIRDNVSIAVSNPPAVGTFDRLGYCGYHIEEVQNLTLCNNATDLFEHGIHIFGNCGGIVIGSNTMHDHVCGIRLQNNLNAAPGTIMSEGFIGIQDRTANRWTGTYSNYGGLNNSSFSMPSSGTMNQFKLPSGSIPPVSSSDYPEDFLWNITATGENGCPPAPPPGLTDGKDVKFATDSPGSNSTFTTFESDRYLLRKMLRYPAIQSENTLFSSFISSKLSSAAGQMAQYDQNFRGAIAVSATMNNSINQNRADRAEILSQLPTIEFTVASITAANASANLPATIQQLQTLANDKKARLLLWSANMQSYATLHQSMEYDRKNAIDAVRTLNAAIPAEEGGIAAAWKVVNQIVADRAAGVYDNEKGLREVAAQCPEKAGAAPIYAIHLMDLDEAADYLPLNEMKGLSACTKEEVGHRHASQEELYSTVVAPNPANDVVTVTGVHPFTAWSISDMQGKEYLNGKIKEQDMLRIETGELQPGTYFLRLLKGDGQQENHKLIIAR